MWAIRASAYLISNYITLWENNTCIWENNKWSSHFLQAIGERGFLRCLQYNLHLTGITTVDLQTPSSVSPHMEPESDSHIYSTEQLSSCTIGLLRRVRKDVLAHAEEKLYHLRSEYMRSDAARALALPLEAELRALFEAIAHDDVALVQWIRRALEIV